MWNFWPVSILEQSTPSSSIFFLILTPLFRTCFCNAVIQRSGTWWELLNGGLHTSHIELNHYMMCDFLCKWVVAWKIQINWRIYWSRGRTTPLKTWSSSCSLGVTNSRNLKEKKNASRKLSDIICPLHALKTTLKYLYMEDSVSVSYHRNKTSGEKPKQWWPLCNMVY